METLLYAQKQKKSNGKGCRPVYNDFTKKRKFGPKCQNFGPLRIFLDHRPTFSGRIPQK